MVYRLKLCAPRNKRHEITKYQIEFIDRICIKGFGFLFFAKNMDKSQNIKYAQRLIDTTKKLSNRCFQDSFNKCHPKKTKANDDLIVNNIVD